MVAVPGVTPETIPVPDPMAAEDGFVLDHVPPVVTSANGVVEPTHTWFDPVIAAGVWFIVTVAVVKQPEPIT